MLLYSLCLVALIHPQEQPPAALHIVAASQFTFMASTQTATSEQWIAEDKTYEKRGARVIIGRKDLDVRWVIDTQKGTYSESPFAPRIPETKSTAQDIHTAGFSYEPEFSWTVVDKAETSTINGRACHLTVVTGSADFAEITLELWLCRTDQPALERRANGPLLELARFRYQNPVTFATELLAKRPDMLLMSLEATVEPPISPTMVHRTSIRTIERGQPPTGIFDLPAGIKKASS